MARSITMIYTCLTRVRQLLVPLCLFRVFNLFVVEKNEWRQIKTDLTPAPRSEHAAIIVEGKDGPKMLIHGGIAAEGFFNEFFLFDLSKLTPISKATH